MTIVFFSQQPTKHSRLGNSLAWMAKVSFFLTQHGLGFVFPWSSENFHSYLSNDSPWLASAKDLEPDTERLFSAIFSAPPNAALLSSVSKQIKGEAIEKARSLHIPQDHIAYTTHNNNVLFLSGSVNISSSKMVELIKLHPIVIIDEPFDLVLNFNPELVDEDWASIKPCKELTRAAQDHVRMSGVKSHGFHVRRGDYKLWRGGCFFYPDSFWLERVSATVVEGYTPWIFTNDPTDPLLGHLTKIGAIVSDGGFESDFTSLMFMDKISGPPSSFTYMASMIAKHALGQVPTLEFYKEMSASD